MYIFFIVDADSWRFACCSYWKQDVIVCSTDLWRTYKYGNRSSRTGFKYFCWYVVILHSLVFTWVWSLKSVSDLSKEHTTDFLTTGLFVYLFFSPGASTSGLNILVVIDTNIMISHLEFVKSLKSEDIPGMWIRSGQQEILRKNRCKNFRLYETNKQQNKTKPQKKKKKRAPWTPWKDIRFHAETRGSHCFCGWFSEPK